MWQKLKHALMTLPLLLTISGCGFLSTKPAFVTDTYCRVYEPVCMSHKDSAATIDQVSDNEVVFKRLCPNEAADGDRKCALLKKASDEKKP